MPALEKRDPWLNLSRFTDARIALGRTGGSVRTQTLLDFRLAHARAKDAVRLPFDAAGLRAALDQAGLESRSVASRAESRELYLLRPDLGRKLHEAARAELEIQRAIWGERDLCVVVSDGLSALAAERQVVPLLTAFVPALKKRGISLYPILIAPFARVKLGDEIGEVLGARHSLMLLGERPGLSSPDSLGAYLTYQPGPARTDADRNCVSNIRAEGLPCADAARVLLELVLESAERKLSGVGLKLIGSAAPELAGV